MAVQTRHLRSVPDAPPVDFPRRVRLVTEARVLAEVADGFEANDGRAMTGDEVAWILRQLVKQPARGDGRVSLRAGQLSPAPDPSPLQPIYDVAILVEEARLKLREAAKVADRENLPAVHFDLMGASERVERTEQNLASWVKKP